ncbi:hypothetical protein BBF93_06880 [Hyphomonas sp. CACIAM 19H1]|uniref:glycosyltransferase n=1 Tax=Hyphomonas sp. CACIAM 19H1 TaxID=1873716 RepID=UPI000DEDB91E|nr:glycosyltransferase family 2 protein [Hyphomonas sp. CACIAM 19H1]AXE63973.1 hypothetical protein BBF93_06880 [Hyphomonas sp. CACIAM 19H1]
MHAPGVVISIPVRNEAELLPRLIDALAGQDICPSLFAVLFLFDSCHDESVSVASAAQQTCGFRMLKAHLPDGPPNAGRARRAACRHALQSVPEAQFLLTTDADTLPSPDWIRRNLAALEAADVVAGRISRENAADLPLRCRQETYLERLHSLRRFLDPVAHDPYPSHPSLGGGSLAFRRKTYEALGGFPAISTGEDTALVAEARLQGWRVRHDRSVHVLTSARTLGRAQAGLSCELAAFPAAAEAILVPDPDAAVVHYQWHNWLRRQVMGVGPLTLPAEFNLAISPARLSELRKAAPSSDAFVEAVIFETYKLPELSLDRAEQRLAQLEAALLPKAEAA